MRIFLIRHGEAIKTAVDSVLTPKGIKQAKNVPRFFDTLTCDLICTSALTRSKQTAHELLVKKKELSAVEMSELNEIYRVLVGGPVKAGTSLDRELLDKKRADKVFDWLFTLKNKNVLLFTHGNLIRYLIAKTLLVDPLSLWKQMVVSPGSISIIEIDKGKAQLKAVNLYSHQHEFLDDFLGGNISDEEYLS